jgi:hypothetical protein
LVLEVCSGFNSMVCTHAREFIMSIMATNATHVCATKHFDLSTLSVTKSQFFISKLLLYTTSNLILHCYYYILLLILLLQPSTSTTNCVCAGYRWLGQNKLQGNRKVEWNPGKTLQQKHFERRNVLKMYGPNLCTLSLLITDTSR